MIYEFRNPMPVNTQLGGGMLVYVRDGGTFCNDQFAVVLLASGQLRHFDSTQFTFLENPTHEIKNLPPTPNA
jgi:hypothetical protein